MVQRRPYGPRISRFEASERFLTAKDRSFPFVLDEDDPNRATISGSAFDRAPAGLTRDTEIRSFVSVQADEVIEAITPAERGQLGRRLLSGWVSDEDLDAFRRLSPFADVPSQQAMREAAADVTLSVRGRPARLRLPGPSRPPSSACARYASRCSRSTC